MFLRWNECYVQLRLPGVILVSRATPSFPRIGGVAHETRVIRPFYSECSCHVLHGCICMATKSHDCRDSYKIISIVPSTVYLY